MITLAVFTHFLKRFANFLLQERYKFASRRPHVTP
jgi:hypothetical protein